MFNDNRKMQYEKYNIARNYFIDNSDVLISLENEISKIVTTIISDNLNDIVYDYNEASNLFPFWQNYPPSDRGRQPKGDQFPWIEVGEHVFGPKFSRELERYFKVRDIGIPTGPDERYVISSEIISNICEITNSSWLFIDVKSVGPRDDQQHIVMSHNQISGDGVWTDINDGVINSIIEAKGKFQSHPFYCAIPPLYILSDGTILPVVHVAIKPIYKMINIDTSRKAGGQPLHKIGIITIPNGLLLNVKPNYCLKYPGLFFPGKDDKGKDPKKTRARLSFEKLEQIDPWRVKILPIK